MLEEGEDGRKCEEEEEIRILKDKTPKTNLPRKHNPTGSLNDFESANLFLLSSPDNLKKIRSNVATELPSGTLPYCRGFTEYGNEFGGLPMIFG